jgi:hypothetical protein
LATKRSSAFGHNAVSVLEHVWFADALRHPSNSELQIYPYDLLSGSGFSAMQYSHYFSPSCSATLCLGLAAFSVS